MLPVEIQARLRNKEISTTDVGPLVVKAFQENRLAVGSLAPDFTLAGAVEQRTVQLATYRGKKPVVLLFGAFG
jgi:hypothetical protein